MPALKHNNSVQKQQQQQQTSRPNLSNWARRQLSEALALIEFASFLEISN